MLWIDVANFSELSEQLQGMVEVYLNQGHSSGHSLSPGAEGSTSAQTCSSNQLTPTGILGVLFTEEVSIEMGIAASKPSTCTLCVYIYKIYRDTLWVDTGSGQVQGSFGVFPFSTLILPLKTRIVPLMII